MFKRQTKQKDKKPRSQILEEVLALIRKVSNNELDQVELEPRMNLKELGFDSIKFMNLVLNLEDVIGKDIEEIIDEVNNLAMINTIEDVVDLVEELR
ncbi:acyl carrier protein [Chitinophaga sp. GbtcB8]|uniref:acyl carrier protein n=1 Tax=Chitinophaga sp. GbtcB8 TaxID=2824753 RepID=UPI001C30D5B4|nr:acyl carrier protein [Chitinophaga sp. GbtcB8]